MARTWILNVLVGSGICVVLALFYFSNQIGNIEPGFIICSNDCTDLNNLSDILVETGWFAEIGGDFHSTPFYWLFVLLIAFLKQVFQDSWQVAYVATMALTLFVTVKFYSRLWSDDKGVEYVTLVLLCGFLLGNISLLIYSKTLLTDFLFSLGGVCFLALAAKQVHLDTRRMLWIVLLFGIALSFLRPNGLLMLLLFGGTVVSGIIFAKRYGRCVLLAAPIVLGFTAWILSAAITTYGVSQLGTEKLEHSDLPALVTPFIKFNYTGDETVGVEDRRGALIVNTPYKLWSLNDGQFHEYLLAFSHRVVKTFEVWIDTFSIKNNVMRSVLYGLIYIGSLSFILSAYRSNDSIRFERLMFASFVIGYLLVFAATSHVTTRFRLFFDVAAALMAAHFYASSLFPGISFMRRV
jgi:hypothetical protein